MWLSIELYTWNPKFIITCSFLINDLHTLMLILSFLIKLSVYNMCTDSSNFLFFNVAFYLLFWLHIGWWAPISLLEQCESIVCRNILKSDMAETILRAYRHKHWMWCIWGGCACILRTKYIPKYNWHLRKVSEYMAKT